MWPSYWLRPWLTAAVLLFHVVAGTTQTVLASIGVLEVEGTSYFSPIAIQLTVAVEGSSASTSST